MAMTFLNFLFKGATTWFFNKVQFLLITNVNVLFQSWNYFKTEAATRGVLSKKVFLKISQNSQENTCATVSFLIKLQV